MQTLNWRRQFHPFESKPERPNGPSMTIPDQTMSVKTIMQRFAAGLPISGGRVPLYEGEDDIFDGVDYKHLDLAEKQEFKLRVQEELEALKSRYEKPTVLEKLPTEDEQSTNLDPGGNPDPKAKLPAEGEKGGKNEKA